MNLLQLSIKKKIFIRKNKKRKVVFLKIE